MIRFSCPKCGATFSAPEERAGKTGKCPCGERVRVPDMMPASTNVAAAVEPRGLVITPKMWVLIIAGGVVLGLFVWTMGNGLVAEWVKIREEAENRQKKEERDRKEAERRRQLEKEREEANERTRQATRQAWREMVEPEAWRLIFGTAEPEKIHFHAKASLQQLIERQSEYQQILRSNGRTLTLQDERKALIEWLEKIQSGLRTELDEQEKKAAFAEFNAELQRVERELAKH